MRLQLAILLALPLASCVTYGYERGSATPQRPTLSADTSVTAFGTAEVEAGVAIDPGDLFDSPATFKLGAFPAGELFFSASPYRKEDLPGSDDGGSSDLVIGMRQRVRDEEERIPSLAYLISTKLPTGRKSNSSGETDFFAAAIATKTFSRFSLTGYYQLGALGEVDSRGTDIEHAVAVAGSLPFGNRMTAFSELAGTHQPEADLSTFFTTTGVAFALSPYRVVDVGVVVGLDSDAPDFQIVLGITENLGTYLAHPRR